MSNFTPTRTVATSMGEPKAFVCEACGKEFETEEELEKHVDCVGLVE